MKTEPFFGIRITSAFVYKQKPDESFRWKVIFMLHYSSRIVNKQSETVSCIGLNDYHFN